MSRGRFRLLVHRHSWSAVAAAVVIAAAGCRSTGPTAKEQALQAWEAQRAALKYELASAELQQGRPEKALTLAREAVGLSPDQPAHAELLARVYLARGDFGAARNVLRAAQARHPDFAPAGYLLGTVYEREQRWDHAIAAYRSALRARPDDVDYCVALAQAVAQAGGVPAAQAVLREHRERFTSEPKYHLACAALCVQAGDLEEACAAYERVLRLGVDERAVRTSLGLCWYWAGRYREALDYLEPLMRETQEPESAVMCAYAGSLLASGQTGQATGWLTRFTTQRPDVAQLWLLLARARAGDDLESASAAASRALSLDPHSPEVQTVVATIHLAAGRLEDAEQAATQALRLEPDNVEALLVYGRVREHAGDCRAAAEAYQAAWDLKPSDVVAELLAGVEK